MTQAITPEEVLAITHLPDDVLDVVNGLIQQNFDGKSAEINQSAIVEALVAKGYIEENILDRGLLNIESTYRAKGWEVVYDKPGFCETYPAKFIFTAKKG